MFVEPDMDDMGLKAKWCLLPYYDNSSLVAVRTSEVKVMILLPTKPEIMCSSMHKRNIVIY